MSKLPFILILLTCGLNAAVLTLDNSGTTGAQYSTFQEAIDAANDGDIIYVYPSTIKYGSNINFNKRLHILGAGHRTEVAGNGAPQFNGFQIRPNASGSTFESIEITSGISILCNAEVSSPVLSFLNCKLKTVGTNSNTIGTNSPHNVIFEGCLFQFPNGNFITAPGDVSGWEIKNNIFATSEIQGALNIFRNFGSGVSVSNNLFLLEKSPTDGFFQNVNGASFTNNIFIFHAHFVVSTTLKLFEDCTNCIFENNSISTLDDLPIELDPSNPQSNNIVQANIIFESSPNGLVFDYGHNFQLAENSDGKNGGKDGTDIGVFGQDFNFRINGYSNFFPRVSSLESDFQGVPINLPVNITIGGRSAGF